jgi:hypothetical protein
MVLVAGFAEVICKKKFGCGGLIHKITYTADHLKMMVFERVTPYIETPGHTPEIIHAADENASRKASFFCHIHQEPSFLWAPSQPIAGGERWRSDCPWQRSAPSNQNVRPLRPM